MKKTLLVIFVISFGRLSFAQEASYELTCRAKAKEIAAETYKNCVTENKSAQLDQIKKEYQQKLKALKDDYEKELQRLNSKAATSSKAAVKPTKLLAKKSAKKSTDDMTIELKPSHNVAAPTSDDSSMDLPEPIPVENIPSESSL